jgi:choline dehydrogenase
VRGTRLHQVGPQGQARHEGGRQGGPGGRAQRGRGGPIRVTALAHTHRNPLGDAFIAACGEAGIAPTPDYNGGGYEGVGYLQLSTGDGRRCSTAIGYLDNPPANLVIETQSVATRVLLEGRRAIGVAYLRRGEARQAFADAEVILSAGPIKSPQLLELSGIGQAPLLAVVSHPGLRERRSGHFEEGR